MRDVEAAALPVLDVAGLRGAVDGKGHLVDAGVDQAPGLLLGERKAVGARIDVDVRKAGLDVLAHLHGALVQERLAVVEEVDPLERGAGLVDGAAEQLEIEHAGLARARDAGLRRAHGLVARDVTGGRALDVHLRGQRPGVHRPDGGAASFFSGSLREQSPQNFDPPALSSSRSRVIVPSPPYVLERGGPHVAQYAPGVRIGAATDDPPVAEHDQRGPWPASTESGWRGSSGTFRCLVPRCWVPVWVLGAGCCAECQRTWYQRTWIGTGTRHRGTLHPAPSHFLINRFMYASSLSFSYLTVFRNRLSAR